MTATALFLGRDLGEQRNYSEEVAALIDEEIKDIVGDGYDKAMQILRGQRAKMDAIVERLKVDETIDAAELDEILASVIGPAAPDPKSGSVTHVMSFRCSPSAARGDRSQTWNRTPIFR